MFQEQLLVRLVAKFASNKGRCIIVVGELEGLGDSAFIFVAGQHIDGIFLRNPAALQVFVEIRTASSTRHRSALQHQGIGTLEVEVLDASQPRACHKGAGVVSVEECGHIAASRLTPDDAAANDVAGNIGRYHAQENEFVAIGVPE